MSAARNPRKDESPLAGGLSGAATKQLKANDSANRAREKELSTIRAKLCLAGGQRLHISTDGGYFVVTPFGQITKFDDLESLAAHADPGAR